MEGVVTLRGIVYSRFKNASEFAKACGHTKQWASKVLRDPTTLSIKQAAKIREVLNYSAEQMPLDIFMPK